MSPIPFAMIGAGGRMGRQIISLVHRLPDAPLRLTGALDAAGSSFLGQDSGVLAGIEANGIKLESELAAALKDARVVIDFSSPQSTLRAAEYCGKAGIALVVGTTGLTAAETEELRKAAAKVPLLVAPNMSVGVNLLFHLVRSAARVLEGYDIEIIEAHHRHKKDAPSGTAMRLKDVLLETLGRSEEDVRHGRHGLVGARTDREIGMHTLRGGDVVGDHTVSFMTEGERIELTHRASSRDTFARGAIAAAAYIAERPAGVYTIDQVLGL